MSTRSPVRLRFEHSRPQRPDPADAKTKDMRRDIEPEHAGACRLALAVATALFATAGAVHAQDPPPPQPRSDRPAVFLDCEGFCDFDYLRRTIEFVDWVRERTVADLHVLVTEETTGAGGSSYTLYFLGQEEFAGRQDTLRFATLNTDTDDARRERLRQRLAQGLVAFAARTGVGPAIDIDFEGDAVPDATRQTRDPWNFWVFRTRVGGEIEGESLERQISVDGSISADRITEGSKIELGANIDYSEDRFEEEEDGEIVNTIVSTSHDWSLDGLMVWSLGARGAVGFETELTSTTRLNQDMSFRLAPAFELSLYPYRESSRRQITALYSVGVVRYEYEEETLFEVMEETRIEQQFEIASAFRQPWGELDASIEWSNYMHDFALHRLDLRGGIDVNLFGGFSFDIRGNVARIKNQIYLPLDQDIPLEEILLRRRQLGTDFEYGIDVGISFTFGSVFNNVVNPRLRRGGNFDFR